jgi:hypothetical protein
MNDLKRVAKRLNVMHYSEQFIESVSKADKVSKYLLFTQVMGYMGMSLPTSVVLFFTTDYLIGRTCENDTDPEPEEVKVNEGVEESGILEYLFYHR